MEKICQGRHYNPKPNPKSMLKWKQLESLRLHQEDIDNLNKIFKDRFFILKPSSDEIIWNGAKSRKYGGKEAYKVISNQQNQTEFQMPI